MVFLGPNLDTSEKKKSAESHFIKGRISVPRGPVDLNPIMEKVYEIFEPDILICWFNQNGNVLVNTDCFKGIKIMFGGDCHHMNRPIERNIHYFLKEKFDFLFNGDRRIVRIFENIIPTRSFWLPGYLADPKSIPPLKNPFKKIVHIGQTSKFHINRNQYLRGFKNFSLPIKDISCPQNEIYDVYNRYSVSLNISLNGDMNSRWYHVPSAGGVLISNNLNKTTGYRNLYTSDEVPTYSSLNEGCDLLKKFLQDDELRYETALKAQKKYNDTMSRYLILKQFFNIINSKEIDPFFLKPYLDDSSKMKLYDASLHWDNLVLYQIIQECVRISARARVDIEGWDINTFTYLNDLEQLDINYITKTNKKQQNGIRSQESIIDARILVTNAEFVERNHSYDIILHKFNRDTPQIKHYKLIKINHNFNLYKKFTDFLSKEPIINKISLAKKSFIEQEYQKNFLIKTIPINPKISNQEILLIGGSVEVFDWLKKIYKNTNFLKLSKLKTLPFFEKTNKAYDVIIFFDDSNSISELSEKLDIIYGLMKLSARLLFHSGQFVLGPYGWVKNYLPKELEKIENNNPWSHLGKIFESSKKNKFETEIFDKKPIEYLYEKLAPIPRFADYNANLIEREFESKGYRILEKEIVLSNQKCPFVLKINGQNIDLNSSAIVTSVEKFNWLE